MSDYGVTPTGLNIKRLDIITNEIHDKLTEGWGVNTHLNPSSFLNVLVTDFADKIAELWEFGAGIYYAMYPSTAEGVNLDYAAQFGGSTRELSAKSTYTIKCKGNDGTVLAYGTRLATTTYPVKTFSTLAEATISRANFVVATVVLSELSQTVYSISLDGNVYKTTGTAQSTGQTILNALKTLINASLSYTCTVTEDAQTSGLYILTITAVNQSTNHAMLLSDNLTTGYVVSLIPFSSDEPGDIKQPANTITRIVTAVTGWSEAWNDGNYVKGRLKEDDVEFRQSYIDKIFNMSSRMCDSIVSALLELDGVDSASAFENPTDHTYLYYTVTGEETASGSYYFEHDSLYYSFSFPTVAAETVLTFSTETKSLTYGNTTVTLTLSLTEPVTGTDLSDDFVSDLYPHSVEVIVDGTFDEGEVGKAILNTKAAGINTFGGNNVDVPDEYEGTVKIRYSVPVKEYIWFKVTITESDSESLPPNYDTLIEEVILKNMNALDSGDDVSPQKWMGELFTTVSGMAYIDILMASTDDSEVTPSAAEYTLRSVIISKRQKAVSDSPRIAVNIDE